MGMGEVKKFILCADLFGKNKDYNRAVLNGCNNGFVKSCSIVANGDAFDAAINDILPECTNISVGINLNLTVGNALTKAFKLTDINNTFKYNFNQLVDQIKKNSDILSEIEAELRAQIEKVTNTTKIYHINSIDNIHLIPEILKIVCIIAEEYNIKYVRVPYEELYYVPDIKHILNFKFIANIFNLIKFNNLSKSAKNIIKGYNLNYNDYFVGLTYKDIMDTKSLEYGLKTLNDEDNITIECAINPCSYLRNINNSRSLEFKMSQDKILEDTIRRMGFEITNHKKL